MEIRAWLALRGALAERAMPQRTWIHPLNRIVLYPPEGCTFKASVEATLSNGSCLKGRTLLTAVGKNNMTCFLLIATPMVHTPRYFVPVQFAVVIDVYLIKALA